MAVAAVAAAARIAAQKIGQKAAQQFGKKGISNFAKNRAKDRLTRGGNNDDDQEGKGSLLRKITVYGCGCLFGLGLFIVTMVMGIFTLFSGGAGEAATPEAGKPGENAYASLIKTVEIPTSSIAPTTTARIPNEEVPSTFKYLIKLKSKSNLSEITCSDNAVLTKSNGTADLLSSPSTNCPTTLTANTEHTFSFDLPIAAEDRFRDSLVTNTFKVNAKGEDTSGVNYFIKYGDTSIVPSNPDSIKNTAGNWPDNNVNKSCPGGVTCWDYVIQQSVANGISPAFSIAIWWEEGGFGGLLTDSDGSTYRANSEFGCFPGGDTSLKIGFTEAFSCFINFTKNEHPYDSSNPSGSWLEWARYFCGPQANPICSNNPGFLTRLRDIYDQVAPGNLGNIPGGGGSTTAFSLTATAIVMIGAPKQGAPLGWPTSGVITQTPYCSKDTSCYTHSSLAAWDIASPDGSYGTPVYASHDGLVTWINSGNLSYGLHVLVVGETYTTLYGHLQAINYNCVPHSGSGFIRTGGLIGWMGSTGNSTGPHLHYEIRNTADSSQVPLSIIYSLAPPHNFGDTVTSSYSGTGCGVAQVDPPAGLENYFNFVGNWTQSQKDMVTNSLAIPIKSDAWKNAVFPAGNKVNVKLDAPDPTCELICSGFVPDANTLTLRPRFFELSNSGRVFVITHELTHVLQYRSPSIFDQYKSSPAFVEFQAKGVIRTYPLCPGAIDSCTADTNPQNEDFAEMAGNYVSVRDGAPPILFSAEYPAHFSFALNILFGGTIF